MGAQLRGRNCARTSVDPTVILIKEGKIGSCSDITPILGALPDTSLEELDLTEMQSEVPLAVAHFEVLEAIVGYFGKWKTLLLVNSKSLGNEERLKLRALQSANLPLIDAFNPAACKHLGDLLNAGNVAGFMAALKDPANRVSELDLTDVGLHPMGALALAQVLVDPSLPIKKVKLGAVHSDIRPILAALPYTSLVEFDLSKAEIEAPFRGRLVHTYRWQIPMSRCLMPSLPRLVRGKHCFG